MNTKVKSNLNKEVSTWLQNQDAEQIARILELGYFTHKISQKVDMMAVSKGQLGESHVYESLKPFFKIKNTAKIAKSGDFHIQTEMGWIMVEVKNYSKTVGKAEVEKFHRDLVRNNNLQAGLFISLHSPIVGIKSKISFENELVHGKSIPIIYVQDSDPEVLRLMVDLLITHMRSDRFRDHKVLTSKIDQLSEDLVHLSRARNHLGETRIVMNKAFDELHTLISLAEINLRRTVDDIKGSVDWKRLIPHEKFEDLWGFVKKTYDLSDDERIVPVRYLKELLDEMYFVWDGDWYYSKNEIMTGTWKVHIAKNTDLCKVTFPVPKPGRKKSKSMTLLVCKERMEKINEYLELSI